MAANSVDIHVPMIKISSPKSHQARHAVGHQKTLSAVGKRKDRRCNTDVVINICDETSSPTRAYCSSDSGIPEHWKPKIHSEANSTYIFCLGSTGLFLAFGGGIAIITSTGNSTDNVIENPVLCYLGPVSLVIGVVTLFSTWIYWMCINRASVRQTYADMHCVRSDVSVKTSRLSKEHGEIKTNLLGKEGCSASKKPRPTFASALMG